jgi:uroporphyrinogen decarboxylase
MGVGCEQELQRYFDLYDSSAIYYALDVDARWVRPIFLRPPEYQGDLMVNWWGSTQGTHSDAYGSRPLANVKTVADIEQYRWPNPDWFDYNAPGKLAEQYSQYALVGATWNPIFSTVCDLCGMERGLMMMALEPTLVEAAVDHITSFLLEYHRRVIDGAPSIDFVYVGDDLAHHRGLMISLTMWRQYFYRPWKRIFDLIHSKGKKVMFHICGACRSLIPDLLDIGMDVLQVVQTTAVGMDPKELKREFGRHLTFWGGVDEQHVLPFGTTGEVRAHVRDLIEVLGEGGGLILGPTHMLQDDTPPANVIALYDEAHRYRPSWKKG